MTAARPDGPPEDPQRTSALRRQLAAHRVPELLYGAVVSGSVLAVSSVHASHDERVLLPTLVVAVVYWLAHVYVDAIGGLFLDTEHTAGQRLRHALTTNWAELLGSVPPLAMYVVGRLVGLEVRGAAFLALWATVVFLMGAGGVAAHRAGRRGGQLVAEVLVSGCFGLVVILLKYALH